VQIFDLSKFITEPTNKLAKRMIYQDNSVIAFILNIAKGASLPPHTHFDCTVLVQVLQGSGQINIEDKSTPMGTGQLVQVEGPENMSIDNTADETLILYVSISPAPPSEQYSKDVDI
jgi:quercetin dioxygenase-like cupin family protein